MGSETVLKELNRLVAMLETGLDSKEPQTTSPRVASEADTVPRAGARDAITAVLNSPERTTSVVSLREAPEVEAFREDLIGGMIRVDTANQLLRLVNEAISRLLV